MRKPYLEFVKKFSFGNDGRSFVDALNFNPVGGLDYFLSVFGGASFKNGLYRVIRTEELDSWRDVIGDAFPKYRNKIMPFGYDWLGRFFCIDSEREGQNNSFILFFSVFSDEVLEIPENLIDFHDKVLVQQGELALEVNAFSNFMKKNGLNCLGVDKCAELINPTYLSGSFDVSNMRVSEIRMYWEISAQILQSTRGIKEGAVIDSVSLKRSH